MIVQRSSNKPSRRSLQEASSCFLRLLLTFPFDLMRLTSFYTEKGTFPLSVSLSPPLFFWETKEKLVSLSFVSLSRGLVPQSFPLRDTSLSDSKSSSAAHVSSSVFFFCCACPRAFLAHYALFFAVIKRLPLFVEERTLFHECQRESRDFLFFVCKK